MFFPSCYISTPHPLSVGNFPSVLLSSLKHLPEILGEEKKLLKVLYGQNYACHKGSELISQNWSHGPTQPQGLQKCHSNHMCPGQKRPGMFNPFPSIRSIFYFSPFIFQSIFCLIFVLYYYNVFLKVDCLSLKSNQLPKPLCDSPCLSVKCK